VSATGSRSTHDEPGCEPLMSLWSRLFGDRPIVTRLVLAVAAAMTVVLVVAGAFVYWRVEFALSRQLDQDLDAYHSVVTRNLSTGATPPTDTPGQSYQVYDQRGRVIGGNARTRLSDVETVTGAQAGETVRQDLPGPYARGRGRGLLGDQPSQARRSTA
jgi:hypothetical protein